MEALMRRTRTLKAAVRGLACLLAVTTTLVCASPRPGWATLAPSALAGQPAQSPTARAADIQTVENALKSEAVKTRLQAMGMSESEVRSRLDKLSDREIRQLASQLDALNPGGDGGFVIGLLVVAVLVLVIVYLVKRV